MSGSLVQEAALAKCSFGTEAPVEEILAMLRFLGVCHGCIGTEAESQVQSNGEMRKILCNLTLRCPGFLVFLPRVAARIFIM